MTKILAKKRIVGVIQFHYLPSVKQPEPTPTKKSQLLFLRLPENKNSETNIVQHSTHTHTQKKNTVFQKMDETK